VPAPPESRFNATQRANVQFIIIRLETKLALLPPALLQFVNVQFVAERQIEFFEVLDMLLELLQFVNVQFVAGP